VKVRVTRLVFHSDKNNYADRDVFKGEEFYLFPGCTYDCISTGGVALSVSPPETWWESFFFEFPSDAIEVIDDKRYLVEPEIPA
jgi:hypothetical protein